MKIKWLKKAAGVYETDSGRFRARKIATGKWVLYDNDQPAILGMFTADSLREAKQLADDQIDSEATE